MKLKKNNILVISLGLIIFFVLIFLVIEFSEKKKVRDKNEEAIQAVIEPIFTCPDKKMTKLYSDMFTKMEEIADSLEAGTKIYSYEDSIYTEVNKELKERYAPYISPKWYESFVRHYKTQYYVYSIADGYESVVNHIDIIQSESIPTNYSFTIYLNYVLPDGEKKDIEIKGSAQFVEDVGKISYIQFFHPELYKELQMSIN